MTSANEEMTLRAYLLGELEDNEQLKLEERLLSDGDFFELLQIVEEELIEAYMRERLSDHERRKFETYFSAAPQRKRKLRTAKALDDYLKSQPYPALERLGFWRRLLRPQVNKALSPASDAQFEAGHRIGMLVHSPAWQAALAAAVLLVAALGVWRAFFSESLTQSGLTALQASFRESPIDGRIADLNWGPKTTTRAGDSPDPKSERYDTSILEARGDLNKAVSRRPSAESYHALGLLNLAEGELDKAVENLRRASEGDPRNARFHSDLGAALLEHAKAEQKRQDGSTPSGSRSMEQIDESLSHLDRALELNPSLLEALFNRALCREYLYSITQAEDDWKAYIEKDGDSPWGKEAKRRLEEIEIRKQQRSEGSDRVQDFLSAYAGRDQEKALSLLSRDRAPLPSRLIWIALIREFLSLAAEGNDAQAGERLAVLSYIGDLQLKGNFGGGGGKGDRYFSELAAFYKSASEDKRRSLAKAHELLRNATGTSDPGDYGRAADAFLGAGDKWEGRLASFLEGYCYFVRQETRRSREILEKVNRDCGQDHHLWLQAQACNALGSVLDQLGELSEAPRRTEKSLEIAKSLDDRYGIQKSLSQLADHYRKLGDFDGALACLNECREGMSAWWPGPGQMWRNYAILARVLSDRRLYASSEDYEREALNLATAPDQQYVSRAHLGISRARQRDYPEAIHQATLGLEAAESITDDRTRMVALAYAALQLGHVYRQAENFGNGLRYYNEVVANIESINQRVQGMAFAPLTPSDQALLPLWLLDSHTGLFLCHAAMGDDGAAEQELRAVSGALEDYRRNIQVETERAQFFEAEQGVFDAATKFAYLRMPNGKEAAFELTESSRARSLLESITRSTDAPERAFAPLKLDEVQRLIPDRMQVIEYAALDQRLVIWVISRDGSEVREVAVTLPDLTKKAIDFYRSVAGNKDDAFERGKALYALLIEPVRALLNEAAHICVVPDKALCYVPFNALVAPSGKFLIEECSLFVSPSASVSIACSDLARRKERSTAEERLLSVGNPDNPKSGLRALPSAAREARAVAAFYSAGPPPLIDGDATESRFRRAIEQADVIHIASHYIVNAWSPIHSRLLLAPDRTGPNESQTSDGVLEASEISSLPLGRARLVVLSACQSGLERFYEGEGPIGMSRAFIAAGVPVVVGSLWPIEEEASADLMIEFHRNRKANGRSTVDALRDAERKMMENPRRRHPYYWAAFVTIGGYADF